MQDLFIQQKLIKYENKQNNECFSLDVLYPFFEP